MCWNKQRQKSPDHQTILWPKPSFLLHSSGQMLMQSDLPSDETTTTTERERITATGARSRSSGCSSTSTVTSRSRTLAEVMES
jgi:hypothetical protein